VIFVNSASALKRLDCYKINPCIFCINFFSTILYNSTLLIESLSTCQALLFWYPYLQYQYTTFSILQTINILVDKMLHMVWYDQREVVQQCSIPIILKSALFSTNCLHRRDYERRIFSGMNFNLLPRSSTTSNRRDHL